MHTRLIRPVPPAPQAWEVLSDGPKRAEYDLTGRVVRSVEEEFMDRWVPLWTARKGVCVGGMLQLCCSQVCRAS